MSILIVKSVFESDSDMICDGFVNVWADMHPFKVSAHEKRRLSVMNAIVLFRTVAPGSVSKYEMH